MAIDRERGQRPGHPGRARSPTRSAILVGGEPVSNFKEGDEQYDVWLRAEAERPVVDRRTLADLTIPSPTAGLVRLGSVARLSEARGPTEIERLDRAADRDRPGATPTGISTGRRRRRAGPGGPRGAGPAAAATRSRSPARRKTLGETGYYFLIAFGLSLLFMYMILAAQFESWTAPGHDPAGPAADDPVRPAVAGPVPDADGPLRDVRPVHAGRHREEERHPAGRLHQRAPRRGACPATRRSWRPTTPGCGRS